MSNLNYFIGISSTNLKIEFFQEKERGPWTIKAIAQQPIPNSFQGVENYQTIIQNQKSVIIEKPENFTEEEFQELSFTTQTLFKQTQRIFQLFQQENVEGFAYGFLPQQNNNNDFTSCKLFFKF